MMNFRKIMEASLLEDKASEESTECADNKKPAVIVLGPDRPDREAIMEAYATRLEGYDLIVYCLYNPEELEEVWCRIEADSVADAEKVYALGILEGCEAAIRLSYEDKRIKAIALISGRYDEIEVAQVGVPVIMVQSRAWESYFGAAQQFYEAIRVEEKMAIWEENVQKEQYVEDPRVMDYSAKHAFRWFNMNATFDPEAVLFL